MRIKRKQNPPRLCIFCGGTPISREHVWADWMRPYLPRGQGTQLIQEGRFDDRSLTVRHGPLHVKGDARSQKLKVVCETCNNRWMSDLQNSAKPVLLPLLTRKHGAIARDERRLLAQWATMFTFVYSTSAPEYTTLKDSQRRAFMADKAPPQHWLYWCAPFDGLSSPIIHCGIADSKNVGPMSGSDGKGDIPVAHVTFCGAGGICFAIFGTNVEGGFQPLAQIVTMAVTQAGFVQLWPSDGLYVLPGARRISAFQAGDFLAIRDAIFDAVVRAKTAEAKTLRSPDFPRTFEVRTDTATMPL